MKITTLVAASLLTFVSGQDEGIFVSNIRSHESWCLTAKESSNDFFVGLDRCSPIATPFIVDGESTQGWEIEDDGKIRSLAYDLCMTVETGSGGNVRGGERIKLRDCDGAGEVNTFTHDADATDTGQIVVDDFESFCLTNDGNAPQDTDTIRAKRCQNKDQFDFTFEDLPESTIPGDSINRDLGDDYLYLISNIRLDRGFDWCITREKRFLGRDRAILERCDDLFEEEDQKWLVEQNGLIRNEGAKDLCLGLDSGIDEPGGVTVILVSCERGLGFNRFTFDPDGDDTGLIGVYPTGGRFCLTNRGSTANAGDPILVERCREVPKFEFTFEDLPESGSGADGINRDLGPGYRFLESNIRLDGGFAWCITRDKTFFGRDRAILEKCDDQEDQKWNIEQNGLIRNDGVRDLCLGIDEPGGDTVILVSCERELGFNRFTFDPDGDDTGLIGVYPTGGRFCLTNRGSTANAGDPIRVEQCRNVPKFWFTYRRTVDV